jgi:hypothetical protein
MAVRLGPSFDLLRSIFAKTAGSIVGLLCLLKPFHQATGGAMTSLRFAITGRLPYQARNPMKIFGGRMIFMTL